MILSVSELSRKCPIKSLSHIQLVICLTNIWPIFNIYVDNVVYEASFELSQHKEAMV